ncbi:hypothetical protein IWQ56_000913 [Coemansia nantahalensis]|nr:hypothetical protein IWQ56_000913 [Coemansia nantahalensis]
MLDAAASCAAPVLTLTLTWLVATCLRVARDCGVAASRLTKGTRPIPPLHAQVFRAVRASGLLRTLRALGGAMADAQPRSRSRPGHERKPQVWKDALRVTDALAAHMWADADGPCGLADELLAGWQLPDGTVWGRTPLEPDTLHPPSAPSAKDDTPSAQWRQLRWLVSVALEALPQLLVAIDAGDAAAPPPALQAAPGYDGDQDSCPTDAEQEPETICYRGRPRPAVAVAEPPAARVPEKPAQARTMPTPLVDTERDEVVCAATAAAMRTHPARGAIGAHRSGPTTMARSSSGSASPAGGRAWQPLDQQLSAEHYSAQTAVNPAAVPEEYGMTAIHAWQQYQAEHQRKQTLEHQLAQQHWIQLELRQQLLAQQQQLQQLQPPPQMLRAARSSELNPTTASVLHMALATPSNAPPSYRQYSALYDRTPTGSGRMSPAPPPLW